MRGVTPNCVIVVLACIRIGAAPLITADEKIRAYPHVRTIW
jgi:acyl-coenzyme A synthetase/AMP-(fatty) acid ligase